MPVSLNGRYTPRRSGFRLTGHVESHIFKKYEVPTFEHYLKLKQRKELDLYAVWKDKRDNLVVNAGLNNVILLLNGGAGVSFPSCGVGSGTALVAPTDTDLTTPIIRISVTQIGQAANVGYWNTFFAGSVGNGTWNETGLFSTNTPASGVMLAHLLFGSSFVKTSSNTGTVAWTITASA